MDRSGAAYTELLNPLNPGGVLEAPMTGVLLSSQMQRLHREYRQMLSWLHCAGGRRAGQISHG